MIVFPILVLSRVSADLCPPLPHEIQEVARNLPYPYEDVCIERWQDRSGDPFFRIRSKEEDYLWKGPTHPWEGEVSAWILRDLEQYSKHQSEIRWRSWLDQSTPWLLAIGSLVITVHLFRPEFYQAR